MQGKRPTITPINDYAPPEPTTHGTLLSFTFVYKSHSIYDICGFMVTMGPT